ncbi:hypothetical protein GQX74_009652 [Glossina fuscipes]|nr:hypothetical protein GQX74_009652 [Glossina fuscipes]
MTKVETRFFGHKISLSPPSIPANSHNTNMKELTTRTLTECLAYRKLICYYVVIFPVDTSSLLTLSAGKLIRSLVFECFNAAGFIFNLFLFIYLFYPFISFTTTKQLNYINN